MLEVVFTESAGGSLLQAQTIKESRSPDGPTAVFYSAFDSQAASQEELDHMMDRLRDEWDRAKPLGGRQEDVFCFALDLSIGDLSVDLFGPERQAFLNRMIAIDDPAFANIGKERLDRYRAELPRFLERVRAGEPVRVWYSDTPDEMCGFYWLMTLLTDEIDIRAVKLPDHEQVDANTLIHHVGWGEIPPGDWHRYLPLEAPVTPSFRRMLRGRWKELVQENAPLRAILNGQLISAGEDLYDCVILRELDKMPEQFHEAVLIGNILGRSQMGISDWLIHSRIQRLVDAGKLQILRPHQKGDPVYHRILTKG